MWAVIVGMVALWVPNSVGVDCFKHMACLGAGTMKDMQSVLH